MSYDPPLVHLPGTRLTPDVVLHRTLNKVERLKGVVVLLKWDDDTWDADWSQLKVSELCVASMILQSQAMRVLNGDEPEAIVSTRDGA